MSRYIAIVVAIMSLAFASPAQAAVKCPGGHNEYSKAASDIRAYKMPRKISGYAPRCYVAEFIVSKVQFKWSESGKITPPKSVSVYGARWGAGDWSIRRRILSNLHWKMIAKRIGSKQKVTWHLHIPKDPG